MVANKADFVIEQGTSWSVGLPVSIKFGEVVTPIDDTWTVKAQVRLTPVNPMVLHEWSTQNGNLTIEEGHVVIGISPSVSSGWYWTNAVYDMEVSKNGATYRAYAGKIKISQEITK